MTLIAISVFMALIVIGLILVVLFLNNTKVLEGLFLFYTICLFIWIFFVMPFMIHA